MIRAALLLAFLAVLTQIAASQITIRLLDGKSGKPLKNLNVTIEWDDDSHRTALNTGSTGSAILQIPGKPKYITVTPGPKVGKEPFRVPYFSCNTYVTATLEEVLSRGITPKSECAHPTVTAKPGEIIFWARRIRWWQPDMQ